MNKAQEYVKKVLFMDKFSATSLSLSEASGEFSVDAINSAIKKLREKGYVIKTNGRPHWVYSGMSMPASGRAEAYLMRETPHHELYFRRGGGCCDDLYKEVV